MTAALAGGGVGRARRTLCGMVAADKVETDRGRACSKVGWRW